MEPGAPWRDPRRGYGYGGAGSAMQIPFQPRSDAGAGGGGGGVLKRSLNEMERWQQQQQQMVMQQAMFLRSVKQRTHQLPSPISPVDLAGVLGPSASPSSVFSGSNLAALTSPSSLSSLTSASRVMPLMQPQQRVASQSQVGFSFASSSQLQAVARPAAPPRAAAASELSMLQELERQLLGDDDEAEGAVSASGSAVTNSEWVETIQQLNSITASAASSPPLPPVSTPNNNNTAMSRSPSNSSSSTASSSASCSPPTSTASSRQLLSDAAAAIADGNMEMASANLAVLKRTANQRGDAEQRLVAMMVAALSYRLGQTASVPSHHFAELCGAEQRVATQLLHDISPCFRLALRAANLAILDAVADHCTIHLVDFDVSATQHAALIQSLAERRVPGTSLKLTAVTDPTSPFTPSATADLTAVRDRLKKLADRAGLDFRFKQVSCRAAEIDASTLGCEPGEALGVNLAFALSRVPDESVSPANPRDELLRRVRALGPQVVTLVEQELNTNTAPLATRFADACAHYGAVLESLDATVGRESPDRARVEAALGRKAANAVGRDGPDRVERCEVFGKWRARFGMAGFRQVALGPGIAEQVRARLGSARPGFTVKPENGVLGLGWMDRVVTVASAWR